MKRFLAVFFTLLFALGLAFCASAASEEGKISLTSSLKSPIRGQTFTVKVKLTRNPGIFSLRAALLYDESILELVSVEDKELLPSFSQSEAENGKPRLHWAAPKGGSDLKESGVLAVLTFRIRSDAPYGDSRVSLEISDRLFDAQNKKGQTVSFDVVPFEFSLTCSHLTTVTETVTAPKFSEAGEGVVRCLDCGEEKPCTLLPEIVSEDGSAKATVQAGEFTDDGEKSIRSEYLFGGDTFEEAKTLFGDGVIRAFRVHLTREGLSYSPTGETKITLKTEFEQPKNFGLYQVTTGGVKKIDASWKDGVLSFLYGEGYFVLVEREEAPAVTTLPEKEEEAPTSPTTTRSEEEVKKEKELRSILLGVAAFVLCGVGAIFVLRRGKPL